MNNKIIEELYNKIDNQENIIRDLQEENNFLEEALSKSDSLVHALCMNTEEENAEDFRKCLDYLEDYKNRIDKAIEYIKNYSIINEDYSYFEKAVPTELLSILKGEE